MLSYFFAAQFQWWPSVLNRGTTWKWMCGTTWPAAVAVRLQYIDAVRLQSVHLRLRDFLDDLHHPRQHVRPASS